jgi:triosephosphate isomerase
MAHKLIVGNWKMHGSLAENAVLLQGLLSGAVSATAHLAVCAPFPYLPQAAQLLQGTAIAWGAQDCSAHARGAYTGEVSAAMLADLGCRYVIVGHSERRQYHAESDALVARKAAAAIRHGLTPIVCLGETLAERERGQTHAVVSRQLQAVIEVLGADCGRMAIAYEPVWAIGTGRVASPVQAQEVHAAIRAQLASRLTLDVAAAVQLLYGGSMKAANAAELLACRDIDGGLVGGASLVADEFLAIASSVAVS